MAEESAIEIFELLSGRRLMAHEVVAGIENMSGEMLTNLISKQHIFLDSQSAGQGKRRQFNLVDVYMLGIATAFLQITSNTANLIDTLNVHFKATETLKYLSKIESSNNADRPLSEDDIAWLNRIEIETSESSHINPEKRKLYFSNRNLANPDYLVVIPTTDQEGKLYLTYHTKNLSDYISKVPSMAVVNVTALLTEIDRKLFQYIKGHGK
ncbi:MAG: hypothetical protein GY761_14220 [Hyphomicrobiales bacterium]|nr:hypothetical protein [Hyphomicrobiales bacterium]